MGIIYAGLIVTAAYNSLAAFLRALGDSKSPLYFLIISAVINVALDVAFIIFGGMGVEGCAYATVIAQGISAVLCLIYIIKKFPILHLKKEDFKISLSAWGRLLALGIPMALQFSITAIGTIIVQGAINVYGENAMAGFSAASKLQNIIMTVFVAFGATIATYVGQNRGAGKMDRVRQGAGMVNQSLFHRVHAVQDGPYIHHQFFGIHGQLIEAFRRNFGILRHKTGNAFLHPLEIFQCLRDTHHQPAHTDRMDRHRG